MRTIEQIIDSGIREGIVNGAVALCGTPTRNLFLMESGFADSSRSVPMRSNTVIDIASVTKTAAMVTSLLIANSRGYIDFDADFTSYLKDYKPKLAERISVRDLANHVSGFMDIPGETRRRYFDESGRKILENILALPPSMPAPATPRYACWNYIILAMILERVTGTSFPDFCKKEIFDPLNMDSSSIGAPRPELPASRIAQTIGTEKPGQISDFVAYRIYRDGGSTGNAGMFSSADDLGKLMSCYLRHGEYAPGKRLFSEKSFAEIAPDRKCRIDGYRRFGWIIYDQRLDDSDFGSSLFHSGWSGQTVFLNLRKNIFIIVLATRYGNYEKAKNDRFEIIRNLSMTMT